MTEPHKPRRRRRKRRFHWRKALFVLPNLFTLSSILCAFVALTTLLNDEPGAIYRATIAIFFGIFFDGTDGRIARLTQTQSGFGVQLDSLADVISFGVTPALLAYRWALAPWGTWGMLVAFLFAACGALRLARFNVAAQDECKHHGASSHFTGLPIPIAAGTLTAAILGNESHGLGWETFPEYVAAGMIFLSYLMVSTVPYRAYKNLKADKAGFTFFLTMLTGYAALAILASPSLAMMTFLGTYVALGFVRYLVRKIIRWNRPPQPAVS